ncbi:MAG: gamma-glutamyltransferase family protein [Aquincola sp.]|nr:gamma-glutamyltransferase family protein [Aquincola sp.]MDH4288351.1 gamma-glutamyltransferase family protein [Aquincola sp.]MDH5329181.1 gamma-glutamyltransferase family protein [Aquincola sp.]
MRRAWLSGALLLLASCASAPPPHAWKYSVPQLPEGASGYTDKPGWSAKRFMVAAANPLATDAGYQILKAGGNALDAAIAVQMVLALVEPQSSGIGGGAFLLHWDGRSLAAWDGRETAPAGADERLFLLPDGKPMAFLDAVVGGRSVGVPGTVRMLEAAHRQHGKLPWSILFQPAITLAEQGFRMSPRLHALLHAETALKADAQARAYFYNTDGEPLAVGTSVRNPALAEVLRGIAARGSAALNAGPVAADIVRRVRGHATNPGRMSETDLAGYEAKTREAICTDWKVVYRVCGFPPPSSGHLAVMQILGLVERTPPVAQPLVDKLPSPDWLHAYTEAARLAYADRAQYLGDPEFVPPPAGRWTSLLDDAYLKQRAALIGRESMRTAKPGVPSGAVGARGAQAEQLESGTSHISVVDGDGHALAMTSTIEAAFGARLMSDGGTGKAGGFLLNNELTDFSFAPADSEGKPIANRVQPGKRPRSSMSPTLVFDKRDGQLVMSLGSPGGAAIIHFTAKTLIGALDWGLDAQRAIDLPNFGSFNGPTVLERGRFPAATIEALKARGHVVNEIEMTSGLQAIQRRGAGWFGGADPRREGVVMGE